MSKEKINNALQRYYKAFDYDAGTLAYKRGGRMGFNRKYEEGGVFNGGVLTPATVTPDISRNNWLRRFMTQAANTEGKSFNDDVYGTGDETWQKISGNNPWVGFTSMALGAVGDAIGSMRTDAEKEKEALRGIETYGDGMFNNISDNDALMIASQNIAPISGLTGKQVGLKSKAEELFSPFVTAISTGLTTGNAYVGAAAGLLDFGKNLIRRNKAEKLMETTRKAAIKKNQDLYKQLYLASGRVDDINDEARMKTFINDAFEYAYGGEMHSHGATFDNGLTFINEGGTHEQNPLEGVPSGVDENGVPNLVEEGEVIWNNEYVFSDRIKIPKRLAEKYKLDEGLTFADAIKVATKESLTRPNDPISNDTNRDIVNEFMDEQEAIRGAEQQKAAQQVQQAIDEDFASQLEAFQGGQMPAPPVDMGMQAPMQEGNPVEGMPPGFAAGGHKFEGGGIPYDRKINGSEFEAQKYYKNFLDYMDTLKDEKEMQEWISYINSEIAKTGSKYRIKDYDTWKRLSRDGKVGPVHQATLLAARKHAAKTFKVPDVELKPFEYPEISFDNNADIETVLTELNANLSKETGKKKKPVKTEGSTDWARLAPIYGAGAMALNDILTGPQYFNADRIIEASRAVGTPVNIPVQTIGDYMKYVPFDTRYLVNLANQNRAAGARAISNTAGGNRAMDILGAMSLAHNNQMELGEIARQAYLANQAERGKVAEFNRGTNLQNMSAINQRNLSQAQLNSQRQQAMLNGLMQGYGLRQSIWQDWRNDRDANLETLFDNLHAYSKDQFGYNQTQGLIDNGYFKWNTDEEGNIWLTPQKVAKGGTKKNKKRRF